MTFCCVVRHLRWIRVQRCVAGVSHGQRRRSCHLCTDVDNKKCVQLRYRVSRSQRRHVVDGCQQSRSGVLLFCLGLQSSWWTFQSRHGDVGGGVVVVCRQPVRLSRSMAQRRCIARPRQVRVRNLQYRLIFNSCCFFACNEIDSLRERGTDHGL